MFNTLDIKVAAPVPVVVKLAILLLYAVFQRLADAILESANVPVHPNVNEVAARRDVLGLPPNVSVTFVSLTLVKADPDTDAAAVV
jgi:hypothetical protein